MIDAGADPSTGAFSSNGAVLEVMNDNSEPKILEILLKAGAETKIFDWEGSTPYDKARAGEKQGWTDYAEYVWLLKKYRAYGTTSVDNRTETVSTSPP